MLSKIFYSEFCELAKIARSTKLQNLFAFELWIFPEDVVNVQFLFSENEDE
jgi:hypothetical protein